jgi:predicted transcriptional regulator
MTTLTIPLDPTTAAALDEIETATKRPKADIVAQAVADFARTEAGTIAAIKRGMADVAAGRTTSHEDAMARLRKTLIMRR